MGYILHDADSWIGEPQVGDKECVALIKVLVPGLMQIGTMNWKQGAHVKSTPNLLRGTAIATFVNGRYPKGPVPKHACIFLAQAGAGIWVMDQYQRSVTIIRRLIQVPRDNVRSADGSWPQANNNAQAFYVIER
ncbi:BPSL0067 family protein [Massilia sp. PAMC28688]|uniref:BPSL0067 family protein n=1 Tax=Massilia sp. PAMC28688 TaxID=2861283 RepID=UPI001C62C2EB|nr:BPSL0067 family protein [Massilia sp. PAMC28688]QYF94210.1 BPSL0067 family protein [Massilia sp. PAMC28688]